MQSPCRNRSMQSSMGHRSQARIGERGHSSRTGERKDVPGSSAEQSRVADGPRRAESQVAADGAGRRAAHGRGGRSASRLRTGLESRRQSWKGRTRAGQLLAPAPAPDLRCAAALLSLPLSLSLFLSLSTDATGIGDLGGVFDGRCRRATTSRVRGPIRIRETYPIL